MSSNNDNKRDEQILSDLLFGVSDKMKNFETDNSKNIKRFKKHMGRVVEDMSDFIDDKTDKVKTSYENMRKEDTRESEDIKGNPFRDFGLFDKADDLFNFGKNKNSVKRDESDNRPTYAPKQDSKTDSDVPSFSEIFKMFGNLGNDNESKKSDAPNSDMFEQLYKFMESNLKNDSEEKTETVDSDTESHSSPVQEDFEKAFEKESDNVSDPVNEKKDDVKKPSDAEFVYGELNKKIFNDERPAVVLNSKNVDLMNEIASLASADGAKTVKLSTKNDDEDSLTTSKMTLDYFINLHEKDPGFAVVSVDAREGTVADLKDLIGKLLKSNRSRLIYVVVTVNGAGKVKEVHKVLG